MSQYYRLRHNLEHAEAISGTLGAALLIAGTTITFEDAPGFATLGTDEYLILRIGDELVALTAYTAAATTGTIARAQEGTSAAAYAQGAAWEHVGSVNDMTPTHVTIPWSMPPVANTNWSTYTASLSQVASSVAQNDEISWDVDLDAGIYDLAVVHRQSNNAGIYTVRIGGKLVATTLGGSSDTIDGYAASTADLRSTITGIVIPTAGRYRINFKMATKNASSSNYKGALIGNAICLTRGS